METALFLVIFLLCVVRNSVVFLQDFSVGDWLKDGENELQVRFMSPVLYASQRYEAHSAYRVPPECPPDVQKGQCHVNFIRKVSMSYQAIFPGGEENGSIACKSQAVMSSETLSC